MHARAHLREPATGPWFWLHPVLAAAVAGVLALGITALRWSVSGVQDSVSMLYVLPVALLAISFGFRAGLLAGAGALGLLIAWVVASGESLTPLGWLSRATPLLLLGSLVGAAAERIRDANRLERRAFEVAWLQREAAEINDSVLQGMAAAKWMLESGQVDEGIELLDTTMSTAQDLVSRMLGSQSVLPGDLRRSLPAREGQTIS